MINDFEQIAIAYRTMTIATSHPSIDSDLIELEVAHVIAKQLVEICRTPDELEKAMINMFNLGQLSTKIEPLLVEQIEKRLTTSHAATFQIGKYIKRHSVGFDIRYCWTIFDTNSVQIGTSDWLGFETFEAALHDLVNNLK